MRILCAGAGSAGLGVCAAIFDGMIRAGLTYEEAKTRFVICNANGALGKKGGGFGDPNYTQGLVCDPTFSFWMSDAVEDGTPMLEVVKAFKPTVLLGLSAQPKIFTEPLIRYLAQRPVELYMYLYVFKCLRILDSYDSFSSVDVQICACIESMLYLL